MSPNPRQSIGHFSKLCNETIEDGVDATPLTRRWPISKMVSVQPVISGLSPTMLSTTVVCTIAAVLLGVIFSRPQMQAFRPLISNVRLEAPIWLPGFKCVRHSPESKVTVETIRLLEMEIVKRGAEFARFGRPVEDLADFRSVTDGDVVEELVLDEVREEDGDPKAMSDGSSEVLPRVHVVENLRWEHHQVSSEEFDYHTSHEVVDTCRTPVSDASSVQTVLHPALVEYCDRLGEIEILRERQDNREFEYQEEQAKRPMTEAWYRRLFRASRENLKRQLAEAEEAVQIAYDTCLKSGLNPNGLMPKETEYPPTVQLDAKDRLQSLRRHLNDLDVLEASTALGDLDYYKDERKWIANEIKEAEADLAKLTEADLVMLTETTDASFADARIHTWLAQVAESSTHSYSYIRREATGECSRNA